MDNREQPLSMVDAFVAKAKSVGTYNPSQATNLTVALNLAKDQFKKSGADPDELKVGDLLDVVDKLLDDYGGENKASFQTIATYKGRARKILNDFIAWNGGEFMAWKTQLAKSANATATRKSKPKPTPATKPADKPVLPIGTTGPLITEQFLEIRLSGNRTGKLVLPDPLTQKDLDVAWKQMDAYKTLLGTRIDIEDEDEEADEAKTD